MRRRNVIGPQQGQGNTQRWKICTLTAHTGERLCSRLTTVETGDQREHATISNQPWQQSPSRLPSPTPWLGARYWAPCCDLSSIVVDLKHSVVTNQNHFCFKNSINQPASLQRDERAETKEMFIQNISFLNLLKKKLWGNDNCEVVRTSAVNQPFEISTFISKRLIVCSGEKNMCNLFYEKWFLRPCSKKSLLSPPNSRYHTQPE